MWTTTAVFPPALLANGAEKVHISTRSAPPIIMRQWGPLSLEWVSRCGVLFFGNVCRVSFFFPVLVFYTWRDHTSLKAGTVGIVTGTLCGKVLVRRRRLSLVASRQLGR